MPTNTMPQCLCSRYVPSPAAPASKHQPISSDSVPLSNLHPSGLLALLLFSCSVVSDSVTPWTACQTSLYFTISQSLRKLMSFELVMSSNHPILCHPLLLLPSIFPSIRVFSSESALYIRQSKYWSFSVSISPSNEYSGLISFRIDWFDLLACSPRDSQESSPARQFKSISSSALSLMYGPTSLSQPNMTTGNTIALTIWTFAGKLMSLLFNPGLVAVNKTNHFPLGLSTLQTLCVLCHLFTF